MGRLQRMTEYPSHPWVPIYRAHRRFIGLGSASTGHWPIMGFKQIPRPPVGASAKRGGARINTSCTSPIYRPGERHHGPLADKSAVLHYTVVLRRPAHAAG